MFPAKTPFIIATPRQASISSSSSKIPVYSASDNLDLLVKPCSVVISKADAVPVSYIEKYASNAGQNKNENILVGERMSTSRPNSKRKVCGNVLGLSSTLARNRPSALRTGKKKRPKPLRQMRTEKQKSRRPTSLIIKEEPPTDNANVDIEVNTVGIEVNNVDEVESKPCLAQCSCIRSCRNVSTQMTIYIRKVDSATQTWIQ